MILEPPPKTGSRLGPTAVPVCQVSHSRDFLFPPPIPCTDVEERSSLDQLLYRCRAPALHRPTLRFPGTVPAGGVADLSPPCRSREVPFFAGPSGAGAWGAGPA